MLVSKRTSIVGAKIPRISPIPAALDLTRRGRRGRGAETEGGKKKEGKKKDNLEATKRKSRNIYNGSY